MKRPTISRLSKHGFGAALVSLLLGAVPTTAVGQELPWVPRGQVRLDFAPSFWTWDSRYGIGPDGTDQVELLGLDLTGDPLGSDLLPDLANLEASLRAALDDPDYRVSLGVSQAFMDKSRLVFPIRLDVGITDWLTIGGMVPLVRGREEITFALDADSLRATEGTSPFGANPTAINNFLDAIRDAVTAAKTSHPDEVVVAEAEAYLDALDAAYRHNTFFPVLGSSPGVRLQERLDGFRQAFLDLGISGLPSTVPLAEGYLDEEQFQEFMGGRFMRAYPLEDWTTLWSIGDVEITANVRLLQGGFEPDSAGVLPRFRYQLGGGVLVRLGTGDQEDPARFFDQDAGDGQMDLEGNVFGRVELGSWFGAWGQVRYGIQQEGEIYRRIAVPSQTLPNYRRTAPLKWTPGNYLELNVNPSVSLTPGTSFGVRYRLWSKGEDSYVLGNVNTEIQDPALLPPAELLNQETEQHLQELGFSATFSTVEAYARGKATWPLFIRATYFRPMSGSGGQTPKGGRFEAGLTIFKALWGGRSSQATPPQNPGGS